MNAKTEQAQQTIYHLARSFPESVRGVILVGSGNWSPAITNDVDFEVVLDQLIGANPHDLQRLAALEGFSSSCWELSTFFQNFSALNAEGGCDYGSHSVVCDEVKISLHITPFHTFRRVCELDLVSEFTTTYLREYRLHPKAEVYDYRQRSLAGDVFVFKPRVEILANGAIAYTPLSIIDNGRYYLGLLPDKYISGRVIYSKDNEVTRLIGTLIRRITARLDHEARSRVVGNGASILSALSRYDVITSEYREELRARFNGGLWQC